jgi:hypothetical protein
MVPITEKRGQGSLKETPMSKWFETLFQQVKESRADAKTIEARIRANWIIDRLAAALGVEAVDHPVQEVEGIPTRYIRYVGYFVDVYMELKQAGLARPTGSWVLIISGRDGTVARTFYGMDLIQTVNHIVKFSRSKRYRSQWTDSSV